MKTPHAIIKYLIIIIIGCAFSDLALAADRRLVYVSIAPQKYFVQQISKNMLDVRVMVAPGASPATYEPKPRQMAGISKAAAYFAVGVFFETKWLKKIAAANPRMRIIHTDHGVQKVPMAALHTEEDDGEEHHRENAEGAGGDHHHGEGGLDPHIWLAPPLVKIQARNILLALQEIDAANASRYESNYQHFIRNIESLDARLKKTLSQWKGRRFMVFHPSWGYFARTYGLEMMAIEMEGKDPKPALLKSLIEHAREEKVKAIFVQPQFSTRNAELIAREVGCRVAYADPLAEDWEANLLQVADKLNAAFK